MFGAPAVQYFENDGGELSRLPWLLTPDRRFL